MLTLRTHTRRAVCGLRSLLVVIHARCHASNAFRAKLPLFTTEEPRESRLLLPRLCLFPCSRAKGWAGPQFRTSQHGCVLPSHADITCSVAWVSPVYLAACCWPSPATATRDCNTGAAAGGTTPLSAGLYAHHGNPSRAATCSSCCPVHRPSICGSADHAPQVAVARTRGTAGHTTLGGHGDSQDVRRRHSPCCAAGWIISAM